MGVVSKTVGEDPGWKYTMCYSLSSELNEILKFLTHLGFVPTRFCSCPANFIFIFVRTIRKIYKEVIT